MSKIAVKVIIFLSLVSFVLSGVKREVDESSDSVEVAEEAVEDNYYEVEEPEPINNGSDSTRPTNVIIREYYFDCVNINSDVEKLTANFSVISNESCLTLYRFAAFEIQYDVVFKNGSSAQTKIQLDIQDSERTQDTIVVTLTGRVIDGYLTGAHFQSVTVYPIINGSQCLTEPGITELKSNSASVTFILLPSSSPVTQQTDTISSRESERTTEAFDCFGNASIDYIPGLVDFKIVSEE